MNAALLEHHRQQLDRLNTVAVDLDDSVMFAIRELVRDDHEGTVTARGHLAAARAALTVAASSIEAALAELQKPELRVVA